MYVFEFQSEDYLIIEKNSSKPIGIQRFFELKGFLSVSNILNKTNFRVHEYLETGIIHTNIGEVQHVFDGELANCHLGIGVDVVA